MSNEIITLSAHQLEIILNNRENQPLGYCSKHSKAANIIRKSVLRGKPFKLVNGKSDLCNTCPYNPDFNPDTQCVCEPASSDLTELNERVLDKLKKNPSLKFFSDDSATVLDTK